ncbi:hypothetical protein BJF79_14065 [Actinomadura sp. CNU-125]|nr:hypothetical protein BJF79_14065 [Actinomadura sp. CNU-125]
MKVQNVAPCTSAFVSSASRTRRSRRTPSSRRGLGALGRSSGIVRAMAATAGSDTRATAQKADRQPQCPPSSAPAGTPATHATVTPPTTTAVARARISGATIRAAAARATAQNPAFANAATTRVPSSTA